MDTTNEQIKQASAGASVTVDLSELPVGQTYEDRYQGFISVFGQIASLPATFKVTVRNAPWCWVPLLLHLNCDLESPRSVFEHCEIVRGAVAPFVSSLVWRGEVMSPRELDRTTVEVLCSFRPETADCLWKIDMQWPKVPGRVREYRTGHEFIVTTNGAFHRPEVIEYVVELEAYVPQKSKVLLVPCAADKPYPSPLHAACLARLPDDFYLMNATGVVGLVPQDLWPIMPHYDSGIPNQWRLYEIARSYFEKHRHTRVVVYCDFYQQTLIEVFHSLEMLDDVRFVLPTGVHYDDYVDLLDENRLNALYRTLHEIA